MADVKKAKKGTSDDKKDKVQPRATTGGATTFWVAILTVGIAIGVYYIRIGEDSRDVIGVEANDTVNKPYIRDMVLLDLGKSADDFPKGIWDRMEAQVRYNALLCNIQFHIVRNFTEVGFKKARIPSHLYEKLRHQFNMQFNTERLDSFAKSEPAQSVVSSPNPSAWVDIGSLGIEIQNELQALHEEWAGVKLKPTAAYGLRVYLNDSLLYRHVDRVETHVVSSIIHVAHNTTDPWPLYIADNTGKAHAMTLEEGEMLFYESAKLPHWRLPMNGRYYTSLFIHYTPIDWPLSLDDCNQRLPNFWRSNTYGD